MLLLQAGWRLDRAGLSYISTTRPRTPRVDA